MPKLPVGLGEGALLRHALCSPRRQTVPVQEIHELLAACPAAATEVRALADAVGGHERLCRCAVCAYLRGEQLSASQLQQVVRAALDLPYRHVVERARSEGAFSARCR